MGYTDVTYYYDQYWAFPMVQLVKKLPAMWETWVGKIPWKRERRPTPVFWLREFHGLYSPWGHKESDTTERLSHDDMKVFYPGRRVWGE